MAISPVVTLTESNFPGEVLRATAPVLVLFWAEWCGPCKSVVPALDELAEQYESRVKVGRINIDEQPALAAEYGVRAVPTLLLVRRGRITDQIVGVRNRRELEDGFDQVMV